MLEHAVDAALVLALLDGLALVVLALTSRKRDDQLGQTPLVDEQAQGHDSDTGLLGVTGDAMDFLTIKEQFAVAMGGVIIVRAVAVLGNIHILDPDLAIDDHAISIGQATLALTDGFNLGSRKHNAGCEGLNNLVVERRLAILDIDRILVIAFSPSHISKNQIIKKPIMNSSNRGKPNSKTEETIVKRFTLSLFTNRLPVPL